MGRLIRLLAALTLAVLLMVFTASNTGWVVIGLWPFEQGLSVQIYWILFAGMFVGVLLSVFVTGADRLKRSLALRRARKRVAQLEARVAELEEQSTPPAEERLLAIERAQRA
ncbi:MAG: LapA family protein [Rhodothalassiaceae bacterium]